MYKITNHTLFNSLAILALCCSTSALAAANIKSCPTLSVADVNDVIFNGYIASDEHHTLLSETNMTAEQIIAKEPTANPYDTYYFMAANKKYHDKKYVIGTGNYLAGNNKEARDRAKQILLSKKTSFEGIFEESIGACVYEFIGEASPSIPGYPFKSSYESVMLFGVENAELPMDYVNKFKMNLNK